MTQCGIYLGPSLYVGYRYHSRPMNDLSWSKAINAPTVRAMAFSTVVKGVVQSSKTRIGPSLPGPP